MSSNTLPLYPKTHTTFTHGHFFLSNNNNFVHRCECGIQRSPDIGVTINRLTVSSMSLTGVINFGRGDERPYLSSSFFEVRSFRNGPCHSSINARLHYNLTFELDGVSPSVFRCTSTPMETGPKDACVET